METLLEKVQPTEHSTHLLKALREDRWQGEDAKQVAGKIKLLMVEAETWMPDFTGSNKGKLKRKERSLVVKGYLGE